MAKRHYEENECIAALKRHSCVNINTADKIIVMAAEGVGIHTLGKIDCLVNYHGYFSRIDKGFKPQVYVRERTENKPFEPKVKKLRMAAMVKMDIRIPKK